MLECSCTIESVEFLYCKNVNYISNLWWVLHILLLLLISVEKQLTCCPPILGDICNKYLLEVSIIGKDSLLNLQGNYSRPFSWSLFSFYLEGFLLSKLIYTPRRIRSHTFSLTTSCLRGWKCLLDYSPLASFYLED